MHCPSITEWYALGTYNEEMINLLVYYNWDNNRAYYYPLEAHGNNLHSHSIILSSPGSSENNLPVRGYYVGGTKDINVSSLCNEPDFGLTDGARSCFSSNVKVGHLSRIEMDFSVTK